MHENGIVRMLIALGVEHNSIARAGDWVNCSCPLAPWTHGSGEDARPSFGVRVDDEELSYYYCFGCTPEGRRLDSLLHNFYIMTGSYPWQAAKIFRTDENHYIEGHENRKKRKPEHWDGWTKEDEEFINPLPYEVLREFDILQFGHDKVADACRKWMRDERLIPTYVANMFKLRYDEINRALIFPLTDVLGGVYLLRSRSIRKKEIWTVSPKVAGYPNLVFPKLRDVGAWFGMEFIDWSKPVLTVEAELDVLRLAALGVYNVIASATSSVSKAQIKALTAAKVLLLGYDADKAGREAHKRIINGVKGRTQGISILELDWSVARKHPKFRKDKKDLKCKDAGDLQGKSGVSRVLRNMIKRA
jgi:hypothetical protein